MQGESVARRASPFVSFRDPGGRTVVGPDRVTREVTAQGWPDLECFLNSPLSRELEDEGHIVTTKIVSETEQLRVFEHDRIAFSSYPFEWPPEMLLDAGRLTLELAERSLTCGLGLKDATPYNVLFRGSSPVFVDVLSFERRSPGDPMWLAYGQFVRNFLLPLILERRFGVPLKNTFLASRDGIDPEAIYEIAGPLRRLMPPILTLATIPTWLGRITKAKASTYLRRAVSPERAQFALERLYRSVRKQLNSTARESARESMWTSYENTCPYTLPQAIEKRNFVERVLKRRRAKHVLDIGCNAGTYSRMASCLGAAVVAIDSDPTVVGTLWQRARADNANILPLVVDIARPSPAGGWRNLEYESFISRCEGQFDCVLMLGMIHHLLVSERVPLDSILDLAADLTTDTVIVEYIGPDDPMFRSLLRGRDRLHAGFNRVRFEQACAARFRIVDTVSLPDCGRVLYYLRKTRTGPAS